MGRKTFYLIRKILLVFRWRKVAFIILTKCENVIPSIQVYS